MTTPPEETAPPSTATPTTEKPPQEQSITAQEFMELYAAKPEDAILWAKKNPASWETLKKDNPEILEKFPELKEI